VRLRLPAALLLVVALLAAFFSWRSGSQPAKDGRAPSVASTPVLSARRVPSLLLSAQRDPVLTDALATIIDDGPTDTCAVVDVGGRTVYSSKSTLPVAPASNQKLVTAQLALDLLGVDYRYTTKVVAAKPTGDTVTGDLTLVGGGDPVLGTKDYLDHFDDPRAVGTSLESLADRIKAAGVRHITGSVVGDESRYDSERDVSTWPDRYLEQHQLGPLTALPVNGSNVDFPPVFTEETRTEATPAEDPPEFAAEKLTELLRERGVRVDGDPRAGRAPAGRPVLAKVTSPPLSDIVRQMLTQSDNQIAELLVKELGFEKGAGGTTAAGLEVMRRAITELGVPVGGVVLHDGSGLDHDDRLTCGLIATLLAQAGPTSPVGEGLAVAGESGTLRERFTEAPEKGRILAKTGTLDDVTALSGFARSVHGPTLTFAYVANGQIIGPDLLALQDRLGEAMVDYAGPLTIRTLGPR
jgi:D-alanyl-D-alanine carboxypeptidase/D-alanyl-D-alanine-endopeptidase (penicillin-binding protein 4)